MNLLSKIFNEKWSEKYVTCIYKNHWHNKLKNSTIKMSKEETTAIVKEAIKRGHGYAYRGRYVLKIYYPILESYNAMGGNWTWKMVEGNHMELHMVRRNLLKDNERTTDQLFTRNLSIPPVYNVDANVQGLSQMIFYGPYVDAKLRCTEAFRTAMSL